MSNMDESFDDRSETDISDCFVDISEGFKKISRLQDLFNRHIVFLLSCRMHQVSVLQ